jgi:hypothetical protein
MSPSCPATGLCLACDAAPSSRAQWRAARRAERTHRWPGGRGPPPPHSRHLLTTAASHGSWSRRSRASRRCSRCGCSGSEFRVHIRRKNKKKNPPLCHPRSRFLSLPLCGACPIVGYCGFLNKLLTQKKYTASRPSVSSRDMSEASTGYAPYGTTPPFTHGATLCYSTLIMYPGASSPKERVAWPGMRALPAACASPELTPERPGASCNPGGSQCMRYVSSRALRYSPLPREPLPLPSSPPVSPSSPPCPAPPVQRQALSLCCCSLASFARLPFRKVIALRERFLTGSAFLMPKRRSRSSPPSAAPPSVSLSPAL